MLNDKNESGTFLIGTLIGGLLGTATALLLAPKSGSKLRQDISDKYCEMSDNVQNWDLSSPFQEAEKPPAISTNMIIGGLIGGGLVVATSILLAPKVGKSLRKNIADTYQEIADSEYVSHLTDLNPFQKAPTKISKLKSLLKTKKK